MSSPHPFDGLSDEFKNNLFSAYLENMSTAIYVKDHEGRYLMGNRRAAEMCGVTHQDLLGQEDLVLFPGPTGAKIRKNDQAVMDGKASISFEESIRRDGQTRVYLSSKSPILNGGETFLGIVGVSTDITERKKLERRLNFSARAKAVAVADGEELKKSFQDLARAAVPTFADICTIDMIEEGRPNREVVYHTDDEFTKKELEAFNKWPPRTADPFGVGYVLGAKQAQVVPLVTDEMLRETAHSQEHYQYLSQLEIHSLISLPLIVRGKLVGVLSLILYGDNAAYSDEDMEIAQVLASKTTLLLENSLLVKDLQNELQDRRAAQEALQSERDRSLAQTHAKTDFLARVSHEIRTPMTGIVGILDLLQQEEVPDPVREKLGLVDECVGTLLGILNDLLDISQVESGNLPLRQAGFDPRTIGLRTCALFEAAARKKDLEFELVVDPKLPTAYQGDAGRIGQILKNFVSNAVKYTEQGSIKVTLREHQGQFRFEVKDTGVGLTEHQSRILFRPFERLGAETTAPDILGAGLGLTITRELAQAMDGEVGVDSRLGEGSTFWCQLPLPLSVAQDEVVDTSDASRHPQKQRTGKILVVEDNPINRRVLVAQLERLHHQVVDACHGAEALEKVATHQFDLIFMDCQMPVMNGFDAARRLRDEKIIKLTTPIVALTADAFASQKTRCIEAGMDDFLSKPCSTEDLRECLSKWLGA